MNLNFIIPFEVRKLVMYGYLSVISLLLFVSVFWKVVPSGSFLADRDSVIRVFDRPKIMTRPEFNRIKGDFALHTYKGFSVTVRNQTTITRLCENDGPLIEKTFAFTAKVRAVDGVDAEIKRLRARLTYGTERSADFSGKYPVPVLENPTYYYTSKMEGNYRNISNPRKKAVINKVDDEIEFAIMDFVDNNPDSYLFDDGDPAFIERYVFESVKPKLQSLGLDLLEIKIRHL